MFKHSPSKRYSINLNNYKISKQIKRGAFGVVYEITNKSNNKKYAAKVILSADSEETKRLINREIKIMIQFQHPTIIHCLGFSHHDFSGGENSTIIMDLAERGSLADILKNVQRGLSEPNYNNTARQKILIGVSYGMMFLHQNHVIHRDLKPGNILIDILFQPHITDFGLSKIYDINHSRDQSIDCGTPGYMAPEVINNDPYNTKADVYSFAIVLYEVVTDSRPYPNFERGAMNAFQLNQKVIDENYRPQFNFSINDNLKKLMEMCWERDPNNRPSFETIFSSLAYDHRYFLDGVNVDEIEDYIQFITNSNMSIHETSLSEGLIASTDSSSKGADEKKSTNTEQKKLITELSKKVEDQQKIIRNMENQIQQLNLQIQRLSTQNDEKDSEIRNLRDRLERNTFESPKEISDSEDEDTDYADMHEQEDYRKRELMNELIEAEDKVLDPATDNHNPYSFSRNDKSRLDYLDIYLNLQNNLRRLYPDTISDLNRRIRALLETLNRENQKNNTYSQLLSGIGTIRGSETAGQLIEKIESYLNRNNY